MKPKPSSIILSILCVLIFTTLVIYALHSESRARVVVEWSTASELDTVGFNIYRSVTSSGDGVLVNRELIPASNDSQTGGNYRFIDSNVVSGNTYYYFLEDISLNGTTHTNGPVVVKAKGSGIIVWILVAGAAVFTLLCIFILLRPQRNVAKG